MEPIDALKLLFYTILLMGFVFFKIAVAVVQGLVAMNKWVDKIITGEQEWTK